MTLINRLGYAGLIPFVALPLLYSWQLWLSSADIIQLYQLYSALILGFMAGVLWPVLHSNSATATKINRLALLAVAFPVLSIITLLLAGEYFLPAQASLFILLRLAEYRSGINRQYQTQYRALRNHLTLVVCLSHLLLYYLVTAAG
ncbi:MAG: DUF3429 domain-containing protein [Gammaproteobacteria bacterium]|nr:DUF3429 domain-containing protein [Gammaproteobacteria bacterium]